MLHPIFVRQLMQSSLNGALACDPTTPESPGRWRRILDVRRSNTFAAERPERQAVSPSCDRAATSADVHPSSGILVLARSRPSPRSRVRFRRRLHFRHRPSPAAPSARPRNRASSRRTLALRSTGATSANSSSRPWPRRTAWDRSLCPRIALTERRSAVGGERPGEADDQDGRRDEMHRHQ
jgi:hypothetical protein